jgi:HAD superfamily hydrolase (TIGR01509 family)
MSLDAVLFDWGHTLFETGSSGDYLRRFAEGAGRTGRADELEEAWERARVASRAPTELAKGRDLSAGQHRECWLALWQELELICPGISTALYEHETTAAGWQPYPDTRHVLAELRDLQVRVAIVSDVPFDLRPIFDAYELRHLVDAFVLSGEHGTIKPEGRLFGIALEALGVSADQALMVGDNPANDGAAVGAGLRTLLLPVPPPGSVRGLDAVLALVRHARVSGTGGA